MMIEFGFLGMNPTEKWLEILGKVKVNNREMERECVLYGDEHVTMDWWDVMQIGMTSRE